MDCLCSNISPKSPLQIGAMDYMGNHLFRAAEYGDMEPFNAYGDRLHRLVDANHNTALHIHSTTGGRNKGLIIESFMFNSKRSDNFLQQLLDRCPSLLVQANARGEIPVHVAARCGHYHIVKFLINYNKAQNGGLEQKLDKEENTALHKAVQYGHLDVVRVLLKENPNLLFSVNKSGESPLYLAARGRYHLLVAHMLDHANSKQMSLDGLRSTKILHAAVLACNESKL